MIDSSADDENIQAGRHVSAFTRLAASAVAGCIGSIVAGLFVSWTYAPLAFWDLTALVLLINLWSSLYPMNATQTRAHATVQ